MAKKKEKKLTKQQLNIAFLKANTKIADLARKLELAEQNTTNLIHRVAQEQERAYNAEQLVAQLKEDLETEKRQSIAHTNKLLGRSLIERILNKT